MSESVLYLHKAISQIEMGLDLQDPSVRIAPIVTVTTGLLEAGLSPEEPLLQSSLRFLQQFYEDQKSSNHNETISENLFAQIKVCLDKARQNPFALASDDWSPSPAESDDLAWLLETLDSFDDSDAVSRAKKFVWKLKAEPAVDATIVIMDEKQYVVSQGRGRSVRIHDLHRTLAEQDVLIWSERLNLIPNHFGPHSAAFVPSAGRCCPFFMSGSILPNVDGFSSVQFDSLIAAVYGLQDAPFWPDKPRQPKQESLVVALVFPLRSNDHRKKSTDEQIATLFSERYQTMLNAFEPHQSVLRRHLLADDLAVLQTVCRLE